MPKPYIIHNGMMSCHYVKICRRVRKEKGGNNTLRVQYLHVENKLKVGLNKIIISYSISTINVRSYCSNDGGGGGSDVRNKGTSPKFGQYYLIFANRYSVNLSSFMFTTQLSYVIIHWLVRLFR